MDEESHFPRAPTGAVVRSLFAGQWGPWPPAGMERQIETSLTWQKAGQRADFAGSGGTSHIDGPDRVYEIYGIQAAAGELLGLGVTAEADIVAWSTASEANPLHREMATRALAEYQAYCVLGVGHHLANFVVRVVALDLRVRPHLLKEFKTDFPPSSMQINDWIALRRTQRLLPLVSDETDLSDLVEVVADLTTRAQWVSLEASRGEDFHQWRPQSVGMMGAARGAFGRVVGNTKVYSVGTDRVLGETLPGKSAQVAHAVARDALDLLPDVMAAVDESSIAPLERLTNLRFRREG